jgi:hypothetical protein
MQMHAPQPVNLQNHAPVPVVHGVQHANVQPAQGTRREARQPHPQDASLLWCTKGTHWVSNDNFGAEQFRTCEHCRLYQCDRARQQREAEEALNAQAAVQQELNQQMNQDEPHLVEPSFDEPNMPLDPLAAITDEDKEYLQKFRDKAMTIEIESCIMCHEEWFDLNVQNDICNKCIQSTKWQAVNEMYPGDVPNLPQLTQMEEMLISPVHALVQLWQI